MNEAQATVIAACIGAGSAIAAAFFAWKSNNSAERAKAFAPTVVALETEAKLLLENLHNRLKPLARHPSVIDSEDTYYEGEFQETREFISTGHITELLDDIRDEYPIGRSVAKIQSLVNDVRAAVTVIDSKVEPEHVGDGDIEALRRAIAQLRQQVKSDLDSEKVRLKAK